MTTFVTISDAGMRATMARSALEMIRSGELMLAEALADLRFFGLNPNANALLEALNWLAVVESYADLDTDDGDTPYLGDRREINRMRRDAAERQYEARVAQLAASADEVAA